MPRLTGEAEGGADMVPWLKIWHEARNDAKLRSLSDAQFRVWFNLLCLASEQEERGAIRMSKKLVSVEAARDDLDLLVETCNALVTLCIAEWRYTDESTLEIVFLKFEKRQSRKPSDDPDRIRERVAKSRGKRRTGNERECNAPVTPPVTPCNAPVTPSVENGAQNGSGSGRKKGGFSADVTPPPVVAKGSAGSASDDKFRCNAMYRGETRIEVEGELELNPLSLKGSPLTASSPHRIASELAILARAEWLLGSDPRTQHLGLELGRRHNLPELVIVPGWKFLRAAQRLLSPEVADAKRGKWSYYLGIVRGLADSEREEKPAAPRESKAQRIYREQQAGIEREKAKRAARRKEAADGDG